MKQDNIKINQRLKNRVYRVASHILSTRCTIRDAAKEFRVSKSTVHKDLIERLPVLYPELNKQVRILLNYHIGIRHLRGGQATKIKSKKRAS